MFTVILLGLVLMFELYFELKLRSVSCDYWSRGDLGRCDDFGFAISQAGPTWDFRAFSELMQYGYQ